MVFQTMLAAEGGRENFTLGDPFVNFDPFRGGTRPFGGGAPGTGAPPGYATAVDPQKLIDLFSKNGGVSFLD